MSHKICEHELPLYIDFFFAQAILPGKYEIMFYTANKLLSLNVYCLLTISNRAITALSRIKIYVESDFVVVGVLTKTIVN